ncbi:MAG TPA: formate dehydrogenase accessory sulfurtransferase FdhD [Candidatus Omnitrophica bacterium]|nr:formate dehydrogenase accessory sulfurtransferase FdhD [Candidatus Omnitrophota bacterium]
MFEKFNITRIYKDRKESLEDFVIKEVPFTIQVNNQELVTLLASPADLKDLTVGFLYSSGLIKKYSDIKSIILDERSWMTSVELKNKKLDKDLYFKRLFTSGCGRGVLFYNSLDLMHRRKIESDFCLSCRDVSRLMKVFRNKSSVFKKTGGVHSAGLSYGKKIILFNEDIGRHNAVDKVIGQALRENAASCTSKYFTNSILCTSGRISSEILLKVKKAAIPVIVSLGAPTDQAVKLARSFNLTLVGFARGEKMNVYSVKNRIK